MLSCSGERLMKLGDYTFLRSFYQNEKCYWSCYTHDNHGCGATALTECGIEAFFIQSLRGKPLIVFNKYTYCRHSIRNGIIRWTCSTHSYKCCKAVVKTSGGHIIEVKGSHNHDASELLINRGKPAVYDLSLSEQILIKSESFM